MYLESSHALTTIKPGVSKQLHNSFEIIPSPLRNVIFQHEFVDKSELFHSIKTRMSQQIWVLIAVFFVQNCYPLTDEFQSTSLNVFFEFLLHEFGFQLRYDSCTSCLCHSAYIHPFNSRKFVTLIRQLLFWFDLPRLQPSIEELLSHPVSLDHPSQSSMLKFTLCHPQLSVDVTLPDQVIGLFPVSDDGLFSGMKLKINSEQCSFGRLMQTKSNHLNIHFTSVYSTKTIVIYPIYKHMGIECIIGVPILYQLALSFQTNHRLETIGQWLKQTVFRLLITNLHPSVICDSVMKLITFTLKHLEWKDSDLDADMLSAFDHLIDVLKDYPEYLFNISVFVNGIKDWCKINSIIPFTEESPRMQEVAFIQSIYALSHNINTATPIYTRLLAKAWTISSMLQAQDEVRTSRKMHGPNALTIRSSVGNAIVVISAKLPKNCALRISGETKALKMNVPIQVKLPVTIEVCEQFRKTTSVYNGPIQSQYKVKILADYKSTITDKSLNEYFQQHVPEFLNDFNEMRDPKNASLDKQVMEYAKKFKDFNRCFHAIGSMSLTASSMKVSLYNFFFKYMTENKSEIISSKSICKHLKHIKEFISPDFNITFFKEATEVRSARSKAFVYIQLFAAREKLEMSLLRQLMRQYPRDQISSLHNGNSPPWRVSYLDGSVSDAGGPGRELMSLLSEEVMDTKQGYFIETPNHRLDEKADPSLIPSPSASLDEMFYVGMLVALAYCSHSTQMFRFAPFVWDYLCGKKPTLAWQCDIDRALCDLLMTPPEELVGMPYTIPSVTGEEVVLEQSQFVSQATVDDYLNRVIEYKTHEFDQVLSALKEGFNSLIAPSATVLIDGDFLREQVCGYDDCPLDALKSWITISYGGNALGETLFSILGSFTPGKGDSLSNSPQAMPIFPQSVTAGMGKSVSNSLTQTSQINKSHFRLQQRAACQLESPNTNRRLYSGRNCCLPSDSDAITSRIEVAGKI